VLRRIAKIMRKEKKTSPSRFYGMWRSSPSKFTFNTHIEGLFLLEDDTTIIRF
jgi:hypothetical protein